MEESSLTETWPPIYTNVLMDRQKRLVILRQNVVGAKEFYKTKPALFVSHWGITYDPRLATKDMPMRLPFILFKRQRELIDFFWALVQGAESGLVEKSRDLGASWLSCAFAVWLWLFWPGAAIGFGSRKEALVDRLGDPDSLVEKIRLFIGGLPRELWPAGFSLETHAPFMKIINPENGATIRGEAGDQIGRGGRTLCYF